MVIKMRCINLDKLYKVRLAINNKIAKLKDESFTQDESTTREVFNLEIVSEQLSLDGGLRGSFNFASSYPQLPMRLIPLQEDNASINSLLSVIEATYEINLIEDFTIPVNTLTNIIGSFTPILTGLLGCIFINHAQIHPHNDDHCG